MGDLDGKTVSWNKNETWRGTVVGSSYIPGFLRIEWSEPKKFTDMARPEDLTVVPDDQTPAS